MAARASSQLHFPTIRLFQGDADGEEKHLLQLGQPVHRKKKTLLVDTVNKKAQVVVPDRKNRPGVGRSSCCKAQMLT